METFILFQNVFRFTLRTLLELSLSGEPKLFLVYKVRLYEKTQAFLQYLFLLFSVGPRHGVVGQKSGTRLETPLLGWALPLKILNHMNLGVDVPVFFHPGDVTSFFPFLLFDTLCFDTLSMVTWYIIQLQIY